MFSRWTFWMVAGLAACGGKDVVDNNGQTPDMGSPADMPPDMVVADMMPDLGPADAGRDAAIDDMTPDTAVDACTPMCAERQCGPDGCGGVCAPCDPAQCGLAEDFLASHGATIVAELEDGDWVFEVPPTVMSLPVGEALLCPDGGCYLTLEFLAVSINQSDTDRLSLDLTLTAWSSDDLAEPVPWAYEVDAGPITNDCTMSFDARERGLPEFTMTTSATFVLDPETGEGTVLLSEPAFGRKFDAEDITIGGNVACVIEGTDAWVDDNVLLSVEAALEQSVLTQTCPACAEPTDCIGGETCVDGVCRSVADESCRSSALTPLCTP